MGSFSPIHLLVLAVVAILLLGGGRFSSLMGDVAKGVKNFKKGMAEDDDDKRSGRDRIATKKTAEPAADSAFDRDGDKVHEDR
ncbi:twin-arginine translocase TatA/TatE family subunit [Hephaestia sp. GCM10023244]|uniref:twin-arginine translocase TatA/TatE family subunit n=1 Tax=unclassified Hephaestia TaxID=2631281 RepID=UPI0020777C30|nr:twin-arginine translocase TatA/TatE family subunit [Hephaestia sp. MAHUQ-44]MCM8730697.1 twin-arginine translocase TatA/TatE family subunit [Hephaestia sp. MAHUQ-44]